MATKSEVLQTLADAKTAFKGAVLGKDVRQGLVDVDEAVAQAVDQLWDYIDGEMTTQGILANNTDVTSITGNSIYLLSGANTYTGLPEWVPAGAKSAGYVMSVAYGAGSQMLIYFSKFYGIMVRFKTSGTWGDWLYGVDPDLTREGAAADAKAVRELFSRARLTGAQIADGTSADAITENGVYFSSVKDGFPDGTIAGLPEGYTTGWLEVTQAANPNLILHTFYPRSGDAPLYRSRGIAGVWRDWQSFITNEKTEKLNELIEDAGMMGLLWPELSEPTSTTYNGISYATDVTSHSVTVSGTATGNSQFNILSVHNGDDWPTWLEKKKTYRIKINSGANVYAEVFERYLSNGSESSFRLLRTNTEGYFALSAESVGILIRLYVPQGAVIASATVYPDVYAAKEKRSLKVLFVGNSYTMNGIVYAPFIFNNALPDVDITIGRSYKDGASIDDYIDAIRNESANLTYNKHTSHAQNWTPDKTGMTMEQIIEDEDWDVVCISQASKHLRDTGHENDLIDGITDIYVTKFDKSLKFGFFMGQVRLPAFTPSGDSTPIDFSDLVAYAETVYSTTPVQFIIPCGTAVENARQIPALDALGDAGHMNYDSNGHLQDGLPKLIAAYTTAMAIADLAGQSSWGVIGDGTYPDAGWAAGIADRTGRQLPGRHGSPVGVTEDNCRLAQHIAVAAIKKPFEITTILR